MNARQVSQADPSNGASNASDFQPPTRNPQTVPGEIFPSAPPLQNPTSEDLLQNSQATISVPDGQDGSVPRTTEAKAGSGLFFLLLVVLSVAALLFSSLLRRRKRSNTRPLEATLQDLQAEIETSADPITKPTASTPSMPTSKPQVKTGSKKKKSKKRSFKKKRRK